MYFQVGGKMMPPSEEGMVFDMTDGGGILAIRMGSPTAAEKRAFKSFPRTRGGDPGLHMRSLDAGSFSPHTRG